MSDIITYNINIEKYALLKKINPDYIRNPYGRYIFPLKSLLYQYIKTLNPTMNILTGGGLQNSGLQNGGYLQKYLKYKRKYMKLKSEKNI